MTLADYWWAFGYGFGAGLALAFVIWAASRAKRACVAHMPPTTYHLR